MSKEMNLYRRLIGSAGRIRAVWSINGQVYVEVEAMAVDHAIQIGEKLRRLGAILVAA